MAAPEPKRPRCLDHDVEVVDRATYDKVHVLCHCNRPQDTAADQMIYSIAGIHVEATHEKENRSLPLTLPWHTLLHAGTFEVAGEGKRGKTSSGTCNGSLGVSTHITGKH